MRGKTLADPYTIKLGRENARLLRWLECSCVSTKSFCRGQPFVYQDCPVARQNFTLLAAAHEWKLTYRKNSMSKFGGQRLFG